jgi:hypothetical protein
MLATVLTAPAVFAASQSNGELVLLAGPGGAALLYFTLWRYYRNTDKSHGFERETRIQSQPVTGSDAKVNEVTGTRSKRIDGANESDHRERVQRLP